MIYWLFCAAVAIENNFFFLAKLESKEIAALILACLSARCSDLTGL